MHISKCDMDFSAQVQ